MPQFTPTISSQAVALLLSSLSLGAFAQDGSITAPTLDTVEVRSATGGSSLQMLPTSATILDGEQVRDRQMQVNLSEGLSSVPGLQIKNRQNYAQDLQLSMRGYGARSTFGVRGVRIYVDGIPATMPDGQGSLGHIDLASIERVEVLRGPYSALYGNSAGGVVSVFTETPEGKPFIEGGVNVGSNGQKRFAAKAGGQTAQGLSYVLSASRFMTDGYRDHSAADRNTANAKLSTAIGDDARLTVTANTMKSYALDPQGLTWDQYVANPRQPSSVAEEFNTRKSSEQTQVGATYERHLNANHSIALTAYAGHRSMEQYQSIPISAQNAAGHAGGVIDMSRDYMGLNASWTGTFEQTVVPVSVTAGLALDTVTEDRQGYENFVGTQKGIRGKPRRDEENTITNVDPYVQASWKLAPKWTLDTGLRYSHVKFQSRDYYPVSAGNPDDSGRVTHSKLLPVISLSHQVTPHDTIYGSIGRGFETPTLAELSYKPRIPNGGGNYIYPSGPNFDLQPNVSNQYELGWRQRMTGQIKGTWSAAVFRSNASNELISNGSLGGRTTYSNAGKTQRQGVELQADLKLSPKWQVQAAYTYLDAKFKEGTVAGNVLPGLSKQSLFVAADYLISPEWRVGISAQHASKVFVNDANKVDPGMGSAYAPAYTVAAASVGYRKHFGAWTLNAFARVDNLFDRQYVGSVIVGDSNSRFFESAPGRNWSTGVNLRYNF